MTAAIRDQLDDRFVALPDGRIGTMTFLSPGSVLVETKGGFTEIRSVASLDGCAVGDSVDRVRWSPTYGLRYPPRDEPEPMNLDRVAEQLEKSFPSIYGRGPETYLHRDTETGERTEMLRLGPWHCLRAFQRSWLNRYPFHILTFLKAVVVEVESVPRIALFWVGEGLANPINVEGGLECPPIFRCGCRNCLGSRTYRVAHMTD
jgi:hypothetical protein